MRSVTTATRESAFRDAAPPTVGRQTPREINEGLNVVESWNRANSVIFFGKGGDIATNRRDEQELSVLCLRVLLWLAVTPSRPAAVGTALAQHEEIVFAAATTGPTNIMATVVCPDMAALYRYLTERVGVLDGVERVETAPLLRHVNQVGAVLP